MTIRFIGRDHYAQLQAGITQTNKMISRGYLKFDENFNAQVTEKYIDAVRTTISMEKELQSIVSEVYSNRNTIVILINRGGVNRITLHWWGFTLYLNDFIIDEIIAHGSMSAAAVAVISASLTFIPVDKGLSAAATRVIATMLALGVVALNFMNRFNTGLRFCYRWASPMPPLNLPIMLVRVRQ